MLFRSTPPGTAAIVRVRREGHDAVLEVEDRGAGLDPERAAHVFERFYRGDPSRSRDHGGAGLGLAIAARIATTHHGTLTIAPSTQGAHFLLRLPTSTPPPQEPLATAASSGPTGARWIPTGLEM